MQELLNQLQSPSWWIAAMITAVVGNLAWALLVWLFPRIARNAAPVARVMVCVYATLAAMAVVYCAVMAPPGWNLYPQPLGWFGDRILLPLGIASGTAAFLALVVVFGPPSAHLLAAIAFSCWAAFVSYGAATYQLGDPATIRIWVASYIYAWGALFLACLVALAFLPFINREAQRHSPARRRPPDGRSSSTGV